MLDSFIIDHLRRLKQEKEDKEHREQPFLYIEEEPLRKKEDKEKDSDLVVIQL